MFVRKKVNRPGSMSIVVASKFHDKFTEVVKFGVIKSEEEADKLFQEAQLFGTLHSLFRLSGFEIPLNILFPERYYLLGQAGKPTLRFPFTSVQNRWKKMFAAIAFTPTY